MVPSDEPNSLYYELLGAIQKLPPTPPTPLCPISLRADEIVAALRRNDANQWNIRVPHFRLCTDCQRELARIHKQKPIKIRKGHPVLKALVTAVEAVCVLIIYENTLNNRRW